MYCFLDKTIVRVVVFVSGHGGIAVHSCIVDLYIYDINLKLQRGEIKYRCRYHFLYEAICAEHPASPPVWRRHRRAYIIPRLQEPLALGVVITVQDAKD